MDTRRQTRNTWLFFGFLLLGGVANLLTRTRISIVDTFMFSLNFMLYIGMLLFWMQSVRSRLLPTRARSYIVASVLLMIVYLLVRVLRFRILTGITVRRFVDYAYNIPMVLGPTLFLMTCIRISRGERAEERGRERLLLIPACALLLLDYERSGLEIARFQRTYDWWTRKTVSLGAYGEKMDFFVLKGWVEALLEDLSIDGLRFVACNDDPSWHPGRCAKVFAGQECIGILGQIHPLVMRNYDVEAEFWCAQLSFDALLKLRGGTPVFRPLPRFPAVTRDIALLCDIAIPAGDMLECIRTAGGETLVDCRVFDVYTGSRIAEGKKSIAFSLTMRSDDQTLTDEHAEAIVQSILTALEGKFGAQMR